MQRQLVAIRVPLRVCNARRPDNVDGVLVRSIAGAACAVREHFVAVHRCEKRVLEALHCADIDAHEAFLCGEPRRQLRRDRRRVRPTLLAITAVALAAIAAVARRAVVAVCGAFVTIAAAVVATFAAAVVVTIAAAIVVAIAAAIVVAIAAASVAIARLAAVAAPRASRAALAERLIRDDAHFHRLHGRDCVARATLRVRREALQNYAIHCRDRCIYVIVMRNDHERVDGPSVEPHRARSDPHLVLVAFRVVRSHVDRRLDLVRAPAQEPPHESGQFQLDGGEERARIVKRL